MAAKRTLEKRNVIIFNGGTVEAVTIEMNGEYHLFGDESVNHIKRIQP